MITESIGLHEKKYHPYCRFAAESYLCQQIKASVWTDLGKLRKRRNDGQPVKSVERMLSN